MSRAEVRLGELILYIADKCRLDRMFGAIKLNKILWRSDFLAFAELGEPITGVKYRSLEHGPAPRRLLPVRSALVGSGAAELQIQRTGGGRTQDRVVPLRAAATKAFTDSQLKLVDRVIDELWGKSAAEVSNLSHGKAWEIDADGDSIPYEAVFLSDDPPNAADVVPGNWPTSSDGNRNPLGAPHGR